MLNWVWPRKCLTWHDVHQRGEEKECDNESVAVEIHFRNNNNFLFSSKKFNTGKEAVFVLIESAVFKH